MADLFPHEYARILWRATQSAETLTALGSATGWREKAMGPENAFLAVRMPWPAAALGESCGVCDLPRVTPYGRRWSDHVRQVPEGACVCLATTPEISCS